MIRKLRKRIEARMRSWGPIEMYCVLVNTFRTIMLRPTRIRKTKYDKVFEAYDLRSRSGLPKTSIYMCRRNYKRCFRRGVAREVNYTASKYGLLHKIHLTGEGLLVDCGANIGELGIWARQHGMRYIAFEPEPLEADCNDLNNFNGERKTKRVALWSHDGKLRFYSKPESCDSSIIDMGGAVEVFEVTAVRLDSVLDVSSLGSGTRILKVEAEGGEPEVLQGASNILKHFDYVVVDAGPERGLQQDITLVDVVNTLQRHGYTMLYANARHLTIAFKNSERHRSGSDAPIDKSIHAT